MLLREEGNGYTFVGNLLDVPYTEAKVGRRVEVVFEQLNDDMTLPQFRLTADEALLGQRGEG